MRKRVLVFGTFDGIHSGHEFFLCSAKSCGTELIVSVARDLHVQEFKCHKPNIPEEQRLLEIQKLPCVDSAQLSDPEISSFKIIEDLSPDLIVLGHDQNELETALTLWMGDSGHHVPMMRMQQYEANKGD